MKIEILGTGCPKCEKLMELVKETVLELGIQAELVKVKDIKEIVKYGVMTTPALVLNGKVVLKGRLPAKAEMLSIITSQNI